MSCHPLYTVYNTDKLNSIASAWEHGQAYNTESSHLSLHFICNDICVLMFCVFHFASFILWKSLQLTVNEDQWQALHVLVQQRL